MSPDGENHRFVLDKGLFRYNPDPSDSPVAMPAEGEGQGAPSKAAPETAKQGAKQGARGARGLLSSKTLTLIVTLLLAAWATSGPAIVRHLRCSFSPTNCELLSPPPSRDLTVRERPL